MVVIVHLANQWSSSWYRASLDTSRACATFGWRFGLVFIAFILLSASGAGGYLLLQLFTQTQSDRGSAYTKYGHSNFISDANYSPDCMHHPCFQNKFLIIVVLILCGIVLFFSCFNCANLGYETKTPITGIFKAALIISNAIFLTFNAGLVQTNFC